MRKTISFEEGQTYLLEVEYKWEGRFPAVQIGMKAPDQHDLMQEAIDMAPEADAVVLIVGTNSDWETEGNDRSSLELPANQDELVTKICEINKNSVVVQVDNVRSLGRFSPNR